MWGFRVPVSVRLAWVLVRPAPVLSTLVSISLAQPETLAFQAIAAALLTVSDLADRSGSKLDRQFLDQKAAVALANIIRQLWVGTRSTQFQTHRRKAAVEISLPRSCPLPLSADDPMPSLAASIIQRQVAERTGLYVPG